MTDVPLVRPAPAAQDEPVAAGVSNPISYIVPEIR